MAIIPIVAVLFVMLCVFLEEDGGQDAIPSLYHERP